VCTPLNPGLIFSTVIALHTSTSFLLLHVGITVVVLVYLRLAEQADSVATGAVLLCVVSINLEHVFTVFCRAIKHNLLVRLPLIEPLNCNIL
jgi:hypothetical protein